ncbi:GNAT family N-acetyltransferase [Paenibacillus turpanensis]|uniref:GNAT family N-acetyltransferase n=1 Tax=Paenibacillus turpanensis TaxID=2689078 RepID=UPI00140BEA6A|nr:GNAT family N-acetyltransferase [Paenibacillus turpanensis]
MAVIETPRLYLRELVLDDKKDLMKVLSDEDSMRYYPHPFSEEEVENWIRWNIDNYQTYKHGLWAVIRKEDEQFLGDCGITMQCIDNEWVPEIGFHIIKQYCNYGYATEAAAACLDYAFDVCKYKEVFSYTSDRNLASQQVATKLGMEFYKNIEKNGEKQIVQKISKGCFPC